MVDIVPCDASMETILGDASLVREGSVAGGVKGKTGTLS